MRINWKEIYRSAVNLLLKLHNYLWKAPTCPEIWSPLSILFIELTGVAISFFIIRPYIADNYVNHIELSALGAGAILMIANTLYFVLKGILKEIYRVDMFDSRYFILFSLLTPVIGFLLINLFWKDKNSLRKYLMILK